MHILLIHQAFASLDEPGGTRHHELARHLAARGHRVTIIASPISYLTGAPVPAEKSPGPRQESGGGITILRAYTYPALHRSFVHRMISFFSFMASSFWLGLRVKGVDLVWGTSPPIFQGATAWALSRLKRAAFLFEVRDLWPAFAVAIGVLRQPALIRLSEWLEAFLYHRANTVIVNSPGFIDHVKAVGARKIVLVPNGADMSMFQPASGGVAFRRQHGLENRFVAMYAGAHGISNDLDIVLEAADLLRGEDRIVFILLGDGKEKPALMKLAAQMNLHNVRFLPPVPKTEMPGALAAADLCIAILKPIPLYATVYPNKVFDYMAAGRPVLLAIDGVIRQVVEKADAGVYVPPGDASALAAHLQTLAADPDLCHRLGANGRRYLEANFDRSILADQFARVVEETL
jgi:glycosyltransferase involved in cell wall biosynthesis